jgi:FMN-dependent NADH-azoreductase
MARLLHVSASPRGAESESLAIANTFLETYRESHAGDEIDAFDLWDGSLPPFGPTAVQAKMAIFAGQTPAGEQAAAWDATTATFQRLADADRYLFSVPMWNSGVPYILKQFIDVVTQPGLAWALDPETGYTGLLTGKKAAVIYTSAVYGPTYRPGFGTDFQTTFFRDWLEFVGVTDITELRFQPNALVEDAEAARLEVLDAARDAAKAF